MMAPDTPAPIHLAAVIAAGLMPVIMICGSR